MKRVGLLAGLMVLTLGPGVVAQEPSPEPPPGFGERIEMPEHGFSVTLPDDWVAFETAGATQSQIDAAFEYFDPTVWVDDTGWLDGFAELASRDVPLWSARTSRSDSCELGRSVYPSFAEAADSHLQWYMDNPDVRDVESSFITVPTGAAYHIRMSFRDGPESDEWWPSSTYLLDAGDVAIEVACHAYGARPEDDWLSVAEGFAFMPPESPSPPPWLGGRVEMPEHGFAITLPDDWVALDTAADGASQLEVAIDAFAPGQWSTDESGWLAGLAEVASIGFPLWAGHTTSSSRCELGRWHDMSLAEAADDHLQWYLDDPDTRDIEPRLVTLPTGTAYRIRMSYWDGPETDEWRPATAYLLDAGGSVVEAYCKAIGARPEDDWRSIVEGFEFLPAEG